MAKINDVPTPRVHRDHPTSQGREKHARRSSSRTGYSSFWPSATELRQWCTHTNAAIYYNGLWRSLFVTKAVLSNLWCRQKFIIHNFIKTKEECNTLFSSFFFLTNWRGLMMLHLCSYIYHNHVLKCLHSGGKWPNKTDPLVLTCFSTLMSIEKQHLVNSKCP